MFGYSNSRCQNVQGRDGGGEEGEGGDGDGGGGLDVYFSCSLGQLRAGALKIGTEVLASPPGVMVFDHLHSSLFGILICFLCGCFQRVETFHPHTCSPTHT